MALNLDQTFHYKATIPIRWTRFGSGPPLLFCHGTPWSSQLWAPIARCFASHFTVHLFDMPGYGQSLLPANAAFQPTYPAQTAAFRALLVHWTALSDDGVFKPHVVAHDIGGHVALRALLLQEEGEGGEGGGEAVPYASLAVVDCGASYPVDEPFFSLVRENAAAFIALPRNLHEAMVRAYIRGASFCGLSKAREDVLVEPWLSAEGQRGFYAQVAAQRNEDVEVLRREYRRLDAELPFCIIWAREDSWVPVERAYKLQERLGGRLKVIADAGHLVQLDAPEALTSELIAWLRSARQDERR